MNFNVSLATPHDAQALFALEHRCFDGDQLGLRSFRHLLKSPSARVWLVKNGDALAGYTLVLTRRNSGWWRIYSVAIAPEQRGKGLSHLLMDRILSEAKLAKAQGIRLEVKVSNHSAIELYRRYQFEVVDILPNYYQDGSDGYRMQYSF
ncbi:GNAT family N-acetyltransferase [Aliidiomarina celeris]|uniref:GNAT family N-acetyltransferase n=1 Tax=Aliidiomarina celeris TaxID=2249428 RepID=UPI000DEADF6E|nr:N-acetyltransferase [Aliidiomarina celeris]